MKPILLHVLLLTAIAETIFGQNDPTAPFITSGGVVNAASYAPPTFPGGGIAQGALFTIFGGNIGPAAFTQAKSYPLGTSLAGVSIKVSQGATSVDAIPFFVSARQVSAIMPSNAPLGADTLVLTFNGKATKPASVTVVAGSVGLFTINSGGTGPVVVQNFVSAVALPVNAKDVPAKPGQTMILYGTGLGASLNGDVNPPQAGDLAAQTEIFVGNQLAPKQYSGRSPCCSGLDQFVFTIPTNAPLGCNVPVLVRTAGAISSNVATLAISADGSACTDATAPFGNITGTGKFGTVLLSRLSFLVPGAGDVVTDVARATFRSEVGGVFAFNPLFSAPPAGSCTAYSAKGNSFGGGDLPGFGPTGGVLQAGTLTVTAGQSKATLTPTSNEYFSLLGASAALAGFKPKSFLDGSSFTVAGAGGKQVGAFSATVPAAPAITWTNRDQVATVTRSAGMTVTWTLSGSTTAQVVLIAGGTYSQRADSSGVFLCTATASAGTFTVPPYILGRLPATDPNATISASVVIVGTMPAMPGASFTATGLDKGTANAASISARTVKFQ